MNIQRFPDAATSLQIREAEEQDLRKIADAIRAVTADLRNRRKFRDLKVAEGALYAQITNAELAPLMHCSPSEIAVAKHRLVEKITDAVASHSRPATQRPDTPAPGMLSAAWESQRPSCPKRTTIGKYVIGLLPDDWRNYVHFHVESLGCSFCSANLHELVKKDLHDNSDSSKRLFNSTIGFLFDFDFDLDLDRMLQLQVSSRCGGITALRDGFGPRPPRHRT